MGNLAGIGKLYTPGRRKRSRSGCRSLGPGKSFRAGQSSSGVGVGNAFQFSQEDLAGVLWVFRAPLASAEPLRTVGAILTGSKWSCLLLRIFLQDALREVTKMYLLTPSPPPL